jgi:HEPN domain-containing protein
VTTADLIAHWRKGAKIALRLAAVCADQRAYELALFHCHLAVEKAIKAAIMEKTRKPHPKVHDLLRLASLLQEDWPAPDQELLDTLSDFAIAARYDDPAWAERFATAKNARRWISRTTSFLAYHKLL